jgi:hypothetical protein
MMKNNKNREPSIYSAPALKMGPTNIVLLSNVKFKAQQIPYSSRTSQIYAATHFQLFA